MVLKTSHLGAYRDLLILFTKYGRRDFRLKLERDDLLLPEESDDTVEPDVQRRAEAFARSLKEMGPTYVKFGQLLSTRPDIVPPDDIPATSVRQDEIHAPATKYFPFASRSVARGATLTVSTVVVVILMLLCWRANRKPEQLTVQENSPNPIPYTLTPGSLQFEGAGAQGVKAPPEGVNVRFNLEVTNTNFRNYRARLFREKNFVQTADKLKAEPNGEQHVVPWTIPGEVLSPGDYQIKLSGVADSGPDAFLEDYSFRVTKK